MPAAKRLNEQFYFDARTRVYDQLNRLLFAVEDRIAGLEQIKTQLGTAVDQITEVALSRLDETFTPLILDAQERLAKFGANFSAQSVTPLTIGLGARILSLLPDQKDGYVYADYVAIRRRGGDEFMIATVDSYDRPNGQLAVTVIDSTGAGTFADWDLRMTVPPDLTHASRTDNPHLTTAAQVGAYTKEETDAQIYTLNEVQSNVLTSTVQAQINQHSTRSDNPHGVTATQTGAYSKAETDARDSLRVAKTGDSMTGALNVGSGNVATRNISIDSANGYLSFNSGTGTEGYLIGKEATSGNSLCFYHPTIGYTFRIQPNGDAKFFSGTNSSSYSTGALTVAGGLGAGGNVYAGGYIAASGNIFAGASVIAPTGVRIGSTTPIFGGAHLTMPSYAELSDGARSTLIGADSSGGFIGSFNNVTFTVRQNNVSRLTFQTDGNNVFQGSLFVAGNATAQDLYTQRAGAPNTGVLFLGNSGGRYLHWDGATYQMPGATLAVGGVSTGAINASSNLSVSGNVYCAGSMYFNTTNSQIVAQAGYLLHDAAGPNYLRSSQAIYIADNNGAPVSIAGGGGLTSIAAALNVGGGLTAYSNVQINGALTTNGYTNLHGTSIGIGNEKSIIYGAVDLGAWGGLTTVGGSLQCNSNVNVNGQYTTGGYTYLRGTTLGWGGETTTVNGHLQANSNQQVAGYLEVLGPLYARQGIVGMNAVINSRLVYAGTTDVIQYGGVEQFGGGVLTGAGGYLPNQQLYFYVRYLQIQFSSGGWATVGYV